MLALTMAVISCSGGPRGGYGEDEMMGGQSTIVQPVIPF